MGFERFDQDIKMGLKSVYLFHGQEKYLVEQYLQKMLDKYVPETYRDFNYTVYDGEKATLDEILDTCETLPFFNACKIVVVKNTPYFRSKKSNIHEAEEERLIEYMASPSESCHLIFITNNSVDKRKKLTKRVEKHGSMIEFGKLNNQIFTKWVHKKIKQLDCEIDGRTLNYLIDRLSYLDKQSSKELLVVDNELRMICSSVQERRDIQVEDIDKFVKKPLDADIFMLVDAVGQKKAEQAIGLMHELIKAGEPVQVIFAMICRQFRLLKKTKMLVGDGYNQTSISKLIGQHPYVIKKVMRQIHLFDSKALTDILEKCSTIDYKMKSTSMDPVLAIETMLVECSYM